MVYKLIVNAAFLAIGYYIGKEVARGESTRKHPTKSQKEEKRPVKR
jgi:hypothetical protein